MDYADVYYVDPRNATVTDHRLPPGSQFGGRVPVRPGTMTVQPASLSPVPPQYSYPTAVAPQWGSPQWGSSQWGYPQLPPYFLPPPQGWGSGMNLGGLGTLVNGIGGIGSLIDIAAQVFTAVMPLPIAPTPADAGDVATGVNADTNSKNLIIYQSALASYAKRDEQIRTIGSLIKRLVG